MTSDVRQAVTMVPAAGTQQEQSVPSGADRIPGMTRRQAMTCLAAGALLVAQGCAIFKRQSELDSALADLESLLEGVGAGNSEELASIAVKIGEQARSLLATHKEFSRDFNRQAVNRSVSADALLQLARNYEVDRLRYRNAMLAAQDELRVAVPADAWPDVLEVLSRKGSALVPRRARQG